jgi:acetyltransferase-like isoleucine patch superfamily enzyme
MSRQHGRAAARARELLVRARVSIIFFRGPILMSEVRKRWAILKNPRATIRFGRGTFAGPGFCLHMPFGGTFITGEGVEFRRGFRAETGRRGRIEIGDGCYFTYDVIISCDTTIEIGKRVGMSQATYVADGSHRYRDLDVPFLEQGYDYRPLTIEDDAQIHAKCTIVNTIGTRSVIGANAVVSRPIPPYCLAAGVPARVIDYFGPEDAKPSELTELSGASASSARSG